jgi:hypothetical protein
MVAGMSVVNGAVGINTTITSISGSYQFVVSDITSITTSTLLNIGSWVSAVVGAQGAQGIPGQNGGRDGAQGPQGATGAQGSITVGGTDTLPPTQGAYVNNSGTNPGNALLYFGIPRGYQGYQGFQGNQGNQGFQGFQGFQGYQGFQGFQGTQGNQGFQGYQGVYYSATSSGVPTTSIWVDTSAPNTDFRGPQGYQGYQGSLGSQGVIGLQGVQGNQGITGPQGANVVHGSFTISGLTANYQPNPPYYVKVIVGASTFGVYQISYYVECTTAASSSTLPAVAVRWYDQSGALRNSTGTTVANPTAGGATSVSMNSGVLTIATNSGGAIAFQTTGYTSTPSNTMTYNLHIVAQYIGPY